jgi:dTDP-3-amino-3,4,6-trideoxy-alpha-D-glucose transaminase
MTLRVPFMTLAPGPDAAPVREAIDGVIERGWFILGPELEAFEAEFATACGARHAIGVGTGTDALALSLRALGVGPGDEVITPPLTAAFTALAVAMAGATPTFADIDEARLTIDPDAVEAAITPRTKAIMPVHLYGQPADMARLVEIGRRHHLAIVEDACQAHLATSAGRPVGTIGAIGAFSFYPTKNLGALGDAGAVVTNDDVLAARVRRLRDGGQEGRYEHVDLGVNSRLDEIQAAVLRARLPLLPAWTDRRRALARRYRAALAGSAVTVPPECDPGHAYHLFPVRVTDRPGFMAHLQSRGIGALVHYPTPVPRQRAFASFHPASCPVADRVCGEICSLPLHPRLTDAEADIVADAVREWNVR